MRTKPIRMTDPVTIRTYWTSEISGKLTALVMSVSLCLLIISCTNSTKHIDYSKPLKLSKATLLDKIKGGWAGQTIGCTYGGPTEFKYKGGLINEQVPIRWYDDYALETFKEDPGLYDDVYMDLTFLEIMAKEGLDAPVSSYALAFANADYKLWHANQAARYNILNGLMPPASGHWMNNPHADDIDFQIESDFIGMICPGMVQTSSIFCDSIGHIMNYGNGWYGGVYLAAMYSLAFVTDDISQVVEEALKTIPEESAYAQCLSDVLDYWKKYPSDWQGCWFEIDKKYGFDVGCPEGVFNGFNIDAVMNSAFVVIGLLYGEGDFLKTMDISTRCGQDSDCNPASAAGILGVMKGYEAIPDQWKPAIEKVADRDFPYTNISLNTVYGVNLKLLDDVVIKNGGTISGDVYQIPMQEPKPVRFEASFEGTYPIEKRVLKKEFSDTLRLKFIGNGVVLMGNVKMLGRSDGDYKASLEAYIDDKKVETFVMPYDYIKRKYDIFHRYGLENEGEHELMIVVRNPDQGYVIEAKEMVVYSSTPLGS